MMKKRRTRKPLNKNPLTQMTTKERRIRRSREEPQMVAPQGNHLMAKAETGKAIKTASAGTKMRSQEEMALETMAHQEVVARMAPKARRLQPRRKPVTSCLSSLSPSLYLSMTSTSG